MVPRASELGGEDWVSVDRVGEPEYINWYLHRLVPIDDNKDQIVVCLTSRQPYKEDQNFEVISKP